MLKNYFNIRPGVIKRKISRFYFVAAQYPVKKIIIVFRKLVILARVRFKNRFKKRINIIREYMRANRDKQHVKLLNSYIIPIVLPHLYGLFYTLGFLYALVSKILKYVLAPFRLIKKYFKWYFSRRV